MSFVFRFWATFVFNKCSFHGTLIPIKWPNTRFNSTIKTKERNPWSFSSVILGDTEQSFFLMVVSILQTFTCSKSNKNTRRRYEICLKLTIKTPKRRQCCSGIVIVNFEHTSHLFLVFHWRHCTDIYWANVNDCVKNTYYRTVFNSSGNKTCSLTVLKAAWWRPSNNCRCARR